MDKRFRTIILFFTFALAGHFNSSANDKIKIYFSTQVNTSVSTGTSAVYLPNGHMTDTIAAYILRAKYSVDIAQYDYTYTSYVSKIAAAVDTAYAHGIIVRWLYDSSQANTGLAYLNPGVPILGGNAGGSAIMHNKFIIIDANSSNPDDAILCTGSEDWSDKMMNGDYNNILFIQDSALAHAYTNEFNMMWGSTTDTPNINLAKFGPAKTDLGQHHFIIGGSAVDLYFSPSDNTNTQILNAINSANTDLYFGVYCFTMTANATAIANIQNSGVYTLGIVDQYTQSQSATVYNTLNNALASSGFKVYTNAYYIYHNKLLIVDPSDPCSDPLVLTGSHNWTNSANDINDENTIIIHDSTIANIYYQSFYSNFTTAGGSLAKQYGCGSAPSGIYTVSNPGNLLIYPNPSDYGDIAIQYNLTMPQATTIAIYNSMGQKVTMVLNDHLQQAGSYSLKYHFDNPGLYLIQCNLGEGNSVQKVIIR